VTLQSSFARDRYEAMSLRFLVVLYIILDKSSKEKGQARYVSPEMGVLWQKVTGIFRPLSFNLPLSHSQLSTSATGLTLRRLSSTYNSH